MDVSVIHRGLEDAGRLINAVRRVPVTWDAEAAGSAPYTLVPPYPDLPMEEVYPREPETCPEIFHTTFGKGRVVYIAGDLDRRFWEYLTPDHGRVLANSVLWTMGGRRTVEVTGPGFLDVTCWSENGRVCCHIVNMTNAHAMRGAMREIYPVSGLELRVRVDGTLPSEVRSLATGSVLDVVKDGDWMRVRVPEVAVHEAIVFELEGDSRLDVGL
jgi:hypothetical protein